MTARSTTLRRLAYCEPERAIAAFPLDKQLLWFGDLRRKSLTLVLRAKKTTDWQNAKLVANPETSPGPFKTGLIGLLSYDDYAPPDWQGDSRCRQSLAWEVSAALIWTAGELELAYEHAADLVEIEQIVATLMTAPTSPSNLQRRTLRPTTDANRYTTAVEEILDDIRSGRFYQLNYLRHFSGEHSARDLAAKRQQWAAQIASKGGKHSAYLELGEETLVSFSPESFVTFDPSKNRLAVSPIKGTSPRQIDAAADAASREELAKSQKNAAELNMIVDLSRHDLYGVALPGSVKVTNPGEIICLEYVYHRQATIEATPRPQLTLGELWRTMCPAASITGAPKREVMHAIAELEQRPRGYFMGNLFWLDQSGALGSSVLIRTATLEGTGHFHYAAGSGIVVHSNPAEELAEVLAKTSVVSTEGDSSSLH
jgi:para-aminobenzoate synthetase component 1